MRTGDGKRAQMRARGLCAGGGDGKTAAGVPSGPLSSEETGAQARGPRLQGSSGHSRAAARASARTTSTLWPRSYNEKGRQRARAVHMIIGNTMPRCLWKTVGALIVIVGPKQLVTAGNITQHTKVRLHPARDVKQHWFNRMLPTSHIVFTYNTIVWIQRKQLIWCMMYETV